MRVRIIIGGWFARRRGEKRLIQSHEIMNRSSNDAWSREVGDFTTEMTVVGKMNHGCKVSRATTQNRCAQTRWCHEKCYCSFQQRWQTVGMVSFFGLSREQRWYSRAPTRWWPCRTGWLPDKKLSGKKLIFTTRASGSTRRRLVACQLQLGLFENDARAPNKLIFSDTSNRQCFGLFNCFERLWATIFF